AYLKHKFSETCNHGMLTRLPPPALHWADEFSISEIAKLLMFIRPSHERLGEVVLHRQLAGCSENALEESPVAGFELVRRIFEFLQKFGQSLMYLLRSQFNFAKWSLEFDALERECLRKSTHKGAKWSKEQAEDEEGCERPSNGCGDRCKLLRCHKPSVRGRMFAAMRANATLRGANAV